MRYGLILTALVVLWASPLFAQPPAQPVRVVDWPVQTVTGPELHLTQETLVQLLLQSTGTLPQGVIPTAIEMCLVSGVTDLTESAIVELPAGRLGCNLGAYADACSKAAGCHRGECIRLCSGFKVLGAHRSCNGNARPTIEPFSEVRHCSIDSFGTVTISCTVAGWCGCDA